MNTYATLVQNGVPHSAPPGFEDYDFTYVISAPFLGGIAISAVPGATTNGLVFYSVSTGAPGIGININISVTGALTVTVSGNTITVTVVNTSTIAQIVAAIQGNAAAAALVNSATFGSGSTVFNASANLTTTPYVLASPAILPVNFKRTISINTAADSIFVWTGLEILPPGGTILQPGVGVRIRYNSTYLSEDYMWCGAGSGNTNTNQSLGTSMSPIPILSPIILPPQSLINVDLAWSTLATTAMQLDLPYFAVALRGYKRRAQ